MDCKRIAKRPPLLEDSATALKQGPASQLGYKCLTPLSSDPYFSRPALAIHTLQRCWEQPSRPARLRLREPCPAFQYCQDARSGCCQRAGQRRCDEAKFATTRPGHQLDIQKRGTQRLTFGCTASRLSSSNLWKSEQLVRPLGDWC